MSLLFLNTACKKEQNVTYPQKNLTTVDIQEVTYSEASPIETFPTTISARKQIDLRTDISGTLEGVLFKESSYVKKGQILYLIEKSRYQAAYDQALAQLEIAQAQLKQSQTDAKRYQNLWAKDAIEKIKLDHALSEIKVAQAQAKSAKAVVSRTKTDLSHTMVRAPFSGYTGVSEVRPGDLIVANQTILTTLAENREMRADIFISDALYAKISRGNKKERLNRSFKLVLPDGVEYSQNGRLEFIDNKVDPKTGTVRMCIIFLNPNDEIKPGMNCIVKVKEFQQNRKKVLLIHQKAIREVLGENFVFVIDKNNKIMEKKVQLGQMIGTKQIVTAGLESGEKIVVEGIQKIKLGDTVKTTPYKESNEKIRS